MDLNVWMRFPTAINVFVDVLRQQMRDAGFPQLVSDLRNHGDATVSSVAALISLHGDIS